MDEPLSNLDAKLRNQMRAEIIKLRQRVNTTFVYVTHDQTEAMTLGDRIVIMKDGYIQQIGTPSEVFDHPANQFVAGFIGTPQMNFFDAQLKKDETGYYVDLEGDIIRLPESKQNVLKAQNVEPQAIVLGIRPEHTDLAAEAGENTLPAKVDVCEMMGSELYVHAQCHGRDTVIRIPITRLQAEHRGGYPYGTALTLGVNGELVHLFSAETGKNLI